MRETISETDQLTSLLIPKGGNNMTNMTEGLERLTDEIQDPKRIPLTLLLELMERTQAILLILLIELRKVSTVTNSVRMTDSALTARRAALHFCSAKNPVARFCFGASCLLGLTGSICSGSAVITCFIGIPIGGLVGCFGARAFTFRSIW